MAFLDNSGDIILDAVLTDIGRKRMADGTFEIAKFGLGDDDINYQLYNKNHPSGSAYYDLEILQTPVREGTTKAGHIHYGLLDITNLNLLYLPSVKGNPGSSTGRPSVWTKPFDQAIGPVFLKNGIIYVAANTDTYNLFDGDASYPNRPNTTERLDGTLTVSGETTRGYVLIETGIDTTAITANSTNRAAYIQATGMLDSTFTVSANQQFIVSVQGPVGSSTVTNADPGGSETLNLTLGFNPAVTGNPSITVSNYADYTIAGCSDQITGLSKFSTMNGPRGNFTALQFAVAGELSSTTLTDQRYFDFGKVNQNLFADSKTYDYIDTTVYVRGDQSGASMQLPIRIIRRNS